MLLSIIGSTQVFGLMWVHKSSLYFLNKQIKEGCERTNNNVSETKNYNSSDFYVSDVNGKNMY